MTIATLLIITVILQTRGQGGISFGAGGQSYRAKKGVEKFLFYATIILAVLFASVSILSALA